MPTVAGMFKRILTLATGAVLGLAFAVVGLRVTAAWSLWPNRDLSRSAGYVKEVMRLVNEKRSPWRLTPDMRLVRSWLGQVRSPSPTRSRASGRRCAAA